LLDEVIGQDHLVGEGGPLRAMIESGILSSFILWGPPGCGKTTLARILAGHTDLHFEQISAIFSGVADLRKIFDAAKIRHRNGRGTLLFVDEIHRFSKSQQDAFLPVMEDGTIILIGATTENPSFELNAALLSRAQVFVLKRLDDAALEIILMRAEEEAGRKLPLDEGARGTLKAMADGDGRYVLSMADQVFSHSSPSKGRGQGEGLSSQINEQRTPPPQPSPLRGGRRNGEFSSGEGSLLNVEQLLKIIQRRAPLYDKSDDGHYNLISAFHKSLRGSDADAALYWMARMLAGGERPEYILRRMACVASEDISNADPHALPLVMAAWQAFERLGLPEGELMMAQACTYLATAPKSNASYMALHAAKNTARETGSLMPPKNILNAPTKLMKEHGYHAGYKYDHDYEGAFSGQNFWPEDLGRQEFYNPPERGFEREIAKRLDYWKKLRNKKES
jgi:putative ATPase